MPRFTSRRLLSLVLGAVLVAVPPLPGLASTAGPELLVESVKVTPSVTEAAAKSAPQTVCKDEMVPVKEPAKSKKTKKADSKAEKPKKDTAKSTKSAKTAKPKLVKKQVCKVIPAKPQPKPKPPVPGSVRIVLQFSKESAARDVNYRWFTLPNPNRMVIDFGDITFQTPLSLVKMPQNSIVSGMRAGSFRPGTVRMVLDHEKPAKVVVFGIPGRRGKDAVGPRLVIDVLGLRKGEKPTDIPPPADVVQKGQAPAPKPKPQPATPESSPTEPATQQEPAEVVPPQVTHDIAEKASGHATVVLDAGHGGVDPGACGKSLHLCEKNLTLDMVKRVRDELQSDQIEVILTRDSDVFIPLPERPRVAQKNNANLFVSLHADAHPTSRTVKGATVYMVSEKASDKEAARLMKSENDRDVMAGVALADESPEVQSILMSLVQRDTLNNSVYLGDAVLASLGKFTEVRKDTLMSAGFRVLKSPDVPSILVEMGYLSNPREEEQLANDAYRAKLAKIIAKGIRSYIESHVHY